MLASSSPSQQLESDPTPRREITSESTSGYRALVLQLRFMSSVMGLSRGELVALSPSGPRQDER
jgi:hypothetical protein